MKLSKETLAIFKNFADINSNIVLKEGNRLLTISNGNTIVGEAAIVEEFPQEFGIYDLNEFLGALSLFEDPEIEFSNKYLNITDGNNSIIYYGADTSVLKTTNGAKSFPEPEAQFNLSVNALNQIKRVAAILKSEDFYIYGDGNQIVIGVGDKSNPTANTFKSVVGTTDKHFKINVKVSNLVIMPGNYVVDISSKKILQLRSNDANLKYLIVAELDSKFDNLA